MSQNDFVIANQTAPAFRADLNSALQALASVSSGATEPATKYANMLWYDTGTNTLKKRNEANSAWINMGAFDEGAGTFTPTGTPPVQTQTTWNTGTSTTESAISPAKLRGVIDNLAEGATGAPRIQFASIGEPVTAGSTQVFLDPGSVSNNNGYETDFRVILANGGSVRLGFSHRVSASARLSYARVKLNGSVVQEWSTNSTVPVDRSVDITFSRGDKFEIEHKPSFTGSDVYSYLSSVSLSTTGDPLFPMPILKPLGSFTTNADWSIV